MIEVSVIIPNWNGLEFLDKCLGSLSKQSFKNSEIILVDNGSVDSSVKYCRDKFPKVRIIEIGYNSGFAHAVNEGIKNSKGKYLVLINNDTEVDKGCIEALVSRARNTKAGFIAAKLLKFDRRDIIDSAGDFIDVVGHANNIGMGEEDGIKFQKAQEVFLATGGGCLIKKEVIEKVGLLDEDYFMYFEDVDWCLRAQLLGFKGYFEPKAKIYHIHKGSSKRVPAKVEYLQFRNLTQTLIKDYPLGLLADNFNWLRIILVNLNTIRYLAGIGYLKEGLAADFWILARLPRLLIKRSNIQKNKRVSDSYIISNIRKKPITFFGLIREGI